VAAWPRLDLKQKSDVSVRFRQYASLGGISDALHPGLSGSRPMRAGSRKAAIVYI
jgi:hypothetical protein